MRRTGLKRSSGLSFRFSVVGEALDERVQRGGPVVLEGRLVHVHEVVAHGGLCTVHVVAPLPQPRHLRRKVQLLPAFGLDNEDGPVSRPYEEVRVVVGDVAGRGDVIQLEADREIILRVRGYVFPSLQELRELQLERTVADETVEDALFRQQVGLVFRNERTRVAEGDRVPDFCPAPIMYGQGVDRFREGVDQSFGRGRLRQVA